MTVPYPPQYPAAPQYPVAPQPAYPVPPSPYPAQQFPGYPPQAPQQPAVPLAQGTLDDYYNQPSTGGGPSISWDQKPVGTSYVGLVARDVTNADVQQQTNFQTKQPEFYRDGRPKFVMSVPLRVNPSPQYPDGEAKLYVRGQMRDELQRAMTEAGVDGAPRGGDLIQVTLVGKRQSGPGLNPANVFAIVYTPAAQLNGQYATPADAVPLQPPVVPPQVQQVAPPQPTDPAPQFQAPLQAPSDLSADQAALLARLTGGQPQQ